MESQTICQSLKKMARVDWSKEMLQKYDRGVSKGVYDIVTGDESWIYVGDCFKMSQIQQKLLAHEALPSK